jgi:hypothetical protein
MDRRSLYFSSLGLFLRAKMLAKLCFCENVRWMWLAGDRREVGDAKQGDRPRGRLAINRLCTSL